MTTLTAKYKPRMFWATCMVPSPLTIWCVNKHHTEQFPKWFDDIMNGRDSWSAKTIFKTDHAHYFVHEFAHLYQLKEMTRVYGKKGVRKFRRKAFFQELRYMLLVPFMEISRKIKVKHGKIEEFAHDFRNEYWNKTPYEFREFWNRETHDPMTLIK